MDYEKNILENINKFCTCDLYNVETEAFAAFFDEFTARYTMVMNLPLVTFEESDMYELIEIRFGKLLRDTKKAIGQIEHRGDNKTLRQQIMKNNIEMAAISYTLYQSSYKRAAFDRQ
jgi:hypothetical protein